MVNFIKGQCITSPKGEKMTHIRSSLCLTFLILTMLFALPHLHAEEIHTYSIDNMDNCTCTGSNLIGWGECISGWSDVLSLNQNWEEDISLSESYIQSYLFADPNLQSWGEDYTYLDDADAAMIATHGGHPNNYHQFTMCHVPIGGGSCHSKQVDMELGDTDLEFLHMFNCHSLCDSLLWGSSQWRASFNGIHILTGFHGRMRVGGSTSCAGLQLLAYDSILFNIAVGDSWVDREYFYISSVDAYMCPIVMVEGNSYIDAYVRIENERYTNSSSYSDPTGDYIMIRYVEGCDPEGELAFDP